MRSRRARARWRRCSPSARARSTPNACGSTSTRERAELFRSRLDERRSPVEAVRFRFLYASELAYRRAATPKRSTRSSGSFVDADDVGAELGADAYINLLMLAGDDAHCAWARSRTAPTGTTATRVCCRFAAGACTSGATGRRAAIAVLERDPPHRSRQPAGALAAEHRAHDARHVSGRRASRAALDPADSCSPVGASDPAVHQRRRGGRPRHLRAVGRRRARGSRTATACSTSWCRRSASRIRCGSSPTTAPDASSIGRRRAA